MRYKDLRDAAILWLLANAAGLITTGLIVISHRVDQPFAGAMVMTSITAAIATALIAVASIASAVLGIRQIAGDHDA